MKKLLLVGLAGVALVGMDVVNAADIDVTAYPTRSPVIAPPRDFEWFGPYVGAIVGGGWQNTRTEYNYSSSPTSGTFDFEDIFGPGPPTGRLNMPGQSAVASALSQGFLSTGFGNKARGFFTAGATVGLNFQMAQIVFGLEADWAWMGGKARTNQFAVQVPVPPPDPLPLPTVTRATLVTNTITEKDGLQWLTTVRGRAGYAIYRALIFATGGAAIARVTATTTETLTETLSNVTTTTTNTDAFSGSGARFATGFVVGGGVEYAFTDYLTAKAEYLFYDLGTVHYPVTTAANPTGVGRGLTINASQRFDGNIFRIGLNFKPDWL